MKNELLTKAIFNALENDVVFEPEEIIKNQLQDLAREEKLELVRKRLMDGYYYQKEIINQLADKLIKELGLE